MIKPPANNKNKKRMHHPKKRRPNLFPRVVNSIQTTAEATLFTSQVGLNPSPILVPIDASCSSDHFDCLPEMSALHLHPAQCPRPRRDWHETTLECSPRARNLGTSSDHRGQDIISKSLNLLRQIAFATPWRRLSLGERYFQCQTKNNIKALQRCLVVL